MRRIEKTLIFSAALLAAQITVAHAQSYTTTTTQTQTYAPPGTATASTVTAPDMTTDTGARPGNDIGTRESLPLSPYASNITPDDTRSTIAPTPPEPAVAPDANVQQLLMAGNQALSSGQTGTADEALEQAETQILTRPVLQTDTNPVSNDPVVAQIEQARQEIGTNNDGAASQEINQILASNAAELSE